MTGLVSIFRSGRTDGMRSRSVADTVLTGQVDIPTLPARLLADWRREFSSGLQLDPGDVEPLPLARARTRWPEYRQCVRAAVDWTTAIGLDGVLAASEIALMACRGAPWHHDAEQYGASAFCNLFLGEDRGQDVIFAGSRQRIPLLRGTTMVFDTAQPHTVVRRGSDAFDAADFTDEQHGIAQFLTWEMPVEAAQVAQALGIAFDIPVAGAWQTGGEHVRLDDVHVRPCPLGGRWLKAT